MDSPLSWVAMYRDGTIITEYSEDGSSRTISEIPKKNLKRITLVNRIGYPVCSQDYLSGQSVIYRKRSLMTSGGSVLRMHILGWAYFNGTDSTNLSVAFIYESDARVEMGHFINGDSVKYPIQLIPEDFNKIEWT